MILLDYCSTELTVSTYAGSLLILVIDLVCSTQYTGTGQKYGSATVLNSSKTIN